VFSCDTAALSGTEISCTHCTYLYQVDIETIASSLSAAGNAMTRNEFEVSIAPKAQDSLFSPETGISVSSTGHESHNVQFQRFGGDLHVEDSSSRFSDAVEGAGWTLKVMGQFAHGFAFLEQEQRTLPLISIHLRWPPEANLTHFAF
jgi:hypothetical protein